jgi:hypothetical protein
MKKEKKILINKYIELCEKVNNSKSKKEYIINYNYFFGWRQGMIDCGYKLSRMEMEANEFYLEKGIDKTCMGIITQLMNSN